MVYVKSHLNVERFAATTINMLWEHDISKTEVFFHVFRAICPEQKVGFKKIYHLHNSLFVFFPQLHIKTLQGMQIEDGP